MSLVTRGDKKEIFDLLVKTVFKFEGDPTIVREMEEYLSRKITSY
ncbi:MAG: hypothetical protein ACREBI_07125 [Nitrosotalea sp.]